MQTFHATTMPAPSYEFGREHDTTLTRTAHWSRQLGIVYGIAAAFSLASGAFIPAAVQVVFAVLFIRSAHNLRAIVQTEGQDVAHLVAASRKLAHALSVRVWLLVIGGPIAALGFVARLMQ